MGKQHGSNEPPVLDVEGEMRFADRAGLPLRMAQPEDDLMDVGGDFPHYIGQRHGVGSATVVRAEADGTRVPLDPRYDLVNHSPDGFEWGYEGSGPAQLALAICADLLNDDAAALAVYQDFKRVTVARLQTDRWTFNALACRRVIDAIRERQAAL